jgi:toxin FitB
MLLVDTNVLSELRNRGRADPNVRAWASNAREADLYISVVTVLELERGVLLMERRDGAQGARLRAWLEDRVIAPFSQRTLPIDSRVARKCAALHVPNPRPERDAMIAATALIHGMGIVTRNVADFDGLGATLLNPWERPTPQ